MTKLNDKTKHLLFTLGLISIGIVILVLLITSKSKVKEKPSPAIAPLVNVQEIIAADTQIKVSGFGTVNPKVEVEIVPQVSGNIVEINPQLKAGGFIDANAMIVRIDSRDYELLVEQAMAAVAQAEVNLETELAEAKIAREEWNLLNPNREPTNSLVLREPQIKEAKAQLQSAQAKLAIANLSLERTEIKLPINVCVREENADLGQYAAAGKSIGSCFGIKTAEIEVPLEDNDLAWFDIPSNPIIYNGQTNSKTGSDAIITTQFAGGEYTWQGKVVRTTGRVDRTSRLVSIIIEVDKPFHTKNRPALLPGTFVEVNILGKKIEKVFAIPRDAIHNTNQIWLFEKGKLIIRDLKILRADDNFIYVKDGLNERIKIITTPMETPTDGMKVRIESAAEANDISAIDMENWL